MPERGFRRLEPSKITVGGSIANRCVEVKPEWLMLQELRQLGTLPSRALSVVVLSEPEPWAAPGKLRRGSPFILRARLSLTANSLRLAGRAHALNAPVCPNTGFSMQASAAEEITEDKDRFEPVSCVRCWQQFHLVNPFTGKVFGDDDDRSRAKLPHVSRNCEKCRSRTFLRPFRNSLSGVQLTEKSLGLLQIERVEALGEPAVDRSEQFASLLRLSLITPEPRHAALNRYVRSGRRRFWERSAAPPLLAQPHLLGELRTRRGLIGRDHRVISR